MKVGRLKSKREQGIFRYSCSLLSGLLDSNQRPRAPQTCALPTALNPDPFAWHQPFWSNAGAKVHTFYETTKFSANFFLLRYIITILKGLIWVFRILCLLLHLQILMNKNGTI